MRALLSVSDKTGIVEFAKGLVDLGIEIISTGGTAKQLRYAKLPVRDVSDVTGMPEMMGGRLKTLHPKVLGGLLARRDVDAADMAAHGIAAIDLVVVNLYPFGSVIKKSSVQVHEAIENIDIGGPTMIRAAAKNRAFVGVVVDAADYGRVLEELTANRGLSSKLREELMVKAFQHTAYYDSVIARYFALPLTGQAQFPRQLTVGWDLVDQMRYGENPHQHGALYRDPVSTEASVVDARVLQGKKLSYNNVMDADAAFRCVREFEQPAAVVVKHTNPCGVAIDKDVTSAFRRAYDADRLSAFGGIVALNRPCTKEIAQELSTVFVEIVLAPEIDPGALALFAAKPNVRVLAIGPMAPATEALELRQVVGGALVQDRSPYRLTANDLSIVTQGAPTPEQMNELLFAWMVARFVKSNSIVVAKSGVTLGVGAGQMSRVDSTHVAIAKAGEESRGAVLASDAFFPFRDSIDAIAKAGIAAIIQPGGSIKDQEVIDACNEYGIAMVFTGRRAFLH